MANTNLGVAKRVKNDEFYTNRQDIEKELQHYQQYFRNKIVYCNCDNPRKSAFWQFFMDVFEDWGLKKVIATYYTGVDGTNTEKWEITRKTGLQPVITKLACNGDFRSEACQELLQEVDIIVTNPPFSLFREYIALLMQYEKQFLVIGSKNAITYKEIFPLLQDNQMWVGYNNPKEFTQPDGSIKAFGNIGWFTNLDTGKRHEMLDIADNHYDSVTHPMYDNYDAIDVSKVKDIPCDYDGKMGVPITFLDKYNPDQFEIIGISGDLANPILIDNHRKSGRFYLQGKRLYDRIVIQRK